MEATKIAESLPNLQKSAALSLCEKCEVRTRYSDNGEQQKWCKTCIGRWERKQQRQDNDNTEQLIENIVHELFRPAQLEHLSKGIQTAFEGLSEGKALMLWGQAGVGKTYSMAAMARHYITEGYTVKSTSYEMLCSRIRSSFQPKATETEYQIINTYTEPDVLFLDDVGTTVSPGKQETDFSLRILLTILDQRLARFKPTFITSNKNIEQLSATFDERIASRIQQICKTIQCKGKDRRLSL